MGAAEGKDCQWAATTENGKVRKLTLVDGVLDGNHSRDQVVVVGVSLDDRLDDVVNLMETRCRVSSRKSDPG